MSTLLAGITTVSSAHPHAWIDLRVSLQFDEQGKITAMQQRWLMDPFMSTLWLEDITRDAAGESREAQLQSAAEQLLDNISGHSYFTRIEHNGQEIEALQAQDPQLIPRDRRLELRFALEWPEPLDPETAPVRYAVFDPTYYIEILHAESDSIRLQGSGLHCDLRIRSPSPDPAKIAYAASLDVHEQPSTELGRHFAEWAEITCER
ncbi:DUF1007 family protein [Halorhodospira abdelmalekii]|uniref:DUF1007 family protein n=1 Tax=Halorhodospira abdelmalekii TaxID=421629 RepID=UPI001903F43B